LGDSWLRTTGEAQRETEAEERSFAGADDGAGDRSEIGFADEPAERRQRRLRSLGDLRDGMNGPADERSSRQRERQGTQSAREPREQGRAQSPAASGCRKTFPHPERGYRVAHTGGSPNDETFETAANFDIQTNQRCKTPATQPLHRSSHEASSSGATTDEGHESMRSSRSFGHRQPGGNAGPAHAAATSADEPENRDHGRPGDAFGHSGEHGASNGTGQGPG
jgi:hypothetical protein